MIHNILNLKNLGTDDILTQKIKNFTPTVLKEFNKANNYLHTILGPLANDMFYQANIALFNSLRECLRDDFFLLEKMVATTYNTPSNNISNFQQNDIQNGFLFQQMQIRNKLQGVFDINESISSNMDSSLSSIIVPGSNNSEVISDNSYMVSLIGFRMDLHDSTKLKFILQNQFNARPSIIEKSDGFYGIQLYFRSEDQLMNCMKKKTYALKCDSVTIKLQQKPNKPGNRFYVKYQDQ
jgi:hypothetical protein